jgi:hypothetical protein
VVTIKRNVHLELLKYTKCTTFMRFSDVKLGVQPRQFSRSQNILDLYMKNLEFLRYIQRK